MMVLLTCLVAFAEPTDAELDRAMELFDNGQDLFNEGRYGDAIAAWTASYDLSKRGQLLFNIANAQERLADYDAAIETLNRYRAFAPAEERGQLDQRVRNLQVLADKQRPLPEPEPEPVPVAPVPVVPDPVPEPKPEPAPESEPFSLSRPVVVGGLLGVSAVALGTGIGAGLASTSAKKRAKLGCVEFEAGSVCSEPIQSDLRAHRTFSVLADAMFIAGTVAGAAGIAVWIAPRKQSTRLVVAPGSVSWRQTF